MYHPKWLFIRYSFLRINHGTSITCGQYTIAWTVLLLTALLAGHNTYAQIIGTTPCTASLGSPIVNETFGSGTGFGPALGPGITNMQYVAIPCPNDGQYTIANYTTGCWGGNWQTTSDHTGNPNGYFMLINASYEPSDFYVQTVNGLCDGTTYLFSSWVMNMDVSVGALPNVTFTVENTNGTILGTYSTGNIPIKNPATWNQYGFYFTTPAGTTTVVLRMHNNAPGGLGNDLALDDITFSPAGPTTAISIQGMSGNTANICSKSLTFLSTVENCYLTNAYQWQLSTDGGTTWTDIPGAINATYTMSALGSGTYLYQLAVAQAGNIGNSSCRVNSNTLAITVSANNILSVTKQALICEGGTYTLPSGKTVNTTGTYNDTLRSTLGCDSLITTINLVVNLAKTAIVDTSVCNGSSYTMPSGKVVSSTGVYQDTLHNMQGCDSLITTGNLTVISAKAVTADTIICNGGHYTMPSGKVINSAGIYQDTLYNINGCDSLITTVSLAIDIPMQLSSQVFICADSSATLTPGSGFSAFLWNTGAATASINTTQAGIYTVSATNIYGCSAYDTFTVAIYPPPALKLPENIVLCKGESKTIDAGSGYQHYLWNTGSTSETISIRDTGTYWILIQDVHGCQASDTTIISQFENPPFGFLPADTTKCSYATITLQANSSFQSYLWSNGSTGNAITITDSGMYWLEVTDSNYCTGSDSTEVKDSLCREAIHVPSAFTPNGDGRNDIFKPIIWGATTQYYLAIYNRWGQKVFETKESSAGWDGTLNGKPQDTGTFVWYINCILTDGSLKKESGTVVLIR